MYYNKLDCIKMEDIMKYTNKKKFKEKNYFGTGIRNVFC